MAQKIYCADGMHGGVAVLLCAVDEVISVLLDKRQVEPAYKFFLELDGYTFEDWLRNPSEAQERLKRAIREGWAEIVNGAYTQPFAENIGLESNIRQLQWGKLLAKKALDANIETYLIQEHAFHTALPQILLKMGYKSVVLRTYWPLWGQHKSYPLQAFYWEGADGSKILTIPHYVFLHSGKVPKERPSLETWIGKGVDPPEEENIVRWLSESGNLGIGKLLSTRDADLTMGGILKDETLKVMGADSRIQFVTPGEYARMVEASAATTEFIHPDDMDTTLPFGLRGDRVIAGSKRVENLLLSAEKFSTIAYLLTGRPVCNPYSMNLGGGQHYKDDLWFAWRKLMLAEQHDIWVCGPSAFAGYSLEDRGLKWLEEAEAICKEILAESTTQILRCVDFNPPVSKSAAIAVFNPLPWSRTDVAEASFEFEAGNSFESITIVDSGGNPVPTQLQQVERYEDGSIAKAHIVFIATNVPGIGYKVFYATEGALKGTSDLKVSENKVENSKITVTLDGRGITEIALKNKVNLMPENCVAARLVAYQGDEGKFVDSAEIPGEIRLLENGPVLARYEIKGSTAIFNFRKRITAYSYLPRVDVEDVVEVTHPVLIGHHTDEPPIRWPEGANKLKGWHTDVFIEEEKLRSVFPLAIEDGIVRRNVVYVPSDTKSNIFSAYDWTDVSDGSKGLTLINRGNFRYHYDKERREVSLILGYSGAFMYTSGPAFHMMHGEYDFGYSLYPHEAFNALQVNRTALEVNTPLIVHGFRYSPLLIKEKKRFDDPGKTGRLPEEFSFMKLDAGSGNISTIYLEDNLPIVRIYENSGEKTKTRVSFFKSIQEAEVLDLENHVVGRLPVNEGAVDVTLNPYDVVTLKLRLA